MTRAPDARGPKAGAAAIPTFPSLPKLGSIPATPSGLAGEARRIHEESVRYWAAYSAELFFHRTGPGIWAPVDQVRHLTTAIRAVTSGLRAPRALVLILFGWPRRASRSLVELKADYEEVLANGGRAGGSYSPRALEPAEFTEAKRADVMSRHSEAVAEFAGALVRWPERALDQRQLPHPLLGKLTVREMVHFTLLHNVHHVRVAERRRLHGDSDGST